MVIFYQWIIGRYKIKSFHFVWWRVWDPKMPCEFESRKTKMLYPYVDGLIVCSK